MCYCKPENENKTESNTIKCKNNACIVSREGQVNTNALGVAVWSTRQSATHSMETPRSHKANCGAEF